MSEFYGDLIVPDVDPLGAASRYTAKDLEDGLGQLGTIAASLGLEALWKRAEFIGSNYTRYPGGPAGLDVSNVFGVSLLWAHVPGIGFWRENYLRFTPEALPEARTEQQRRGIALIAKRLEREIAERAPEVAAVRQITTAANASRQLPFPVAAATDVQGTWAYNFQEAYRRRLAYALAYEASITHGSLAPFEERFSALSVGTTQELMACTPDPHATGAFSLYLNLSALLEQVLHYEAKHSDAAPRFPGRMIEAEAKRQYLATQLSKVAPARMESLVVDGRVAVGVLLQELEQLRRKVFPYDGTPPPWGKIASWQLYRQGEA